MRHEDAGHQLKASDCLEKLAEISQEIGNHQQAISDLMVSSRTCLTTLRLGMPETTVGTCSR